MVKVCEASDQGKKMWYIGEPGLRKSQNYRTDDLPDKAVLANGVAEQEQEKTMLNQLNMLCHQPTELQQAQDKIDKMYMGHGKGNIE